MTRALLVGTTGIAASLLVGPVATPVAFAGTLLAGAAAGWLARERGALVGFACALIVAGAWGLGHSAWPRRSAAGSGHA